MFTNYTVTLNPPVYTPHLSTLIDPPFLSYSHLLRCGLFEQGANWGQLYGRLSTRQMPGPPDIGEHDPVSALEVCITLAKPKEE